MELTNTPTQTAEQATSQSMSSEKGKPVKTSGQKQASNRKPGVDYSLDEVIARLSASKVSPEKKLAELKAHPLYDLEPSPGKKAWASIKVTKTAAEIKAMFGKAGGAAVETRKRTQAEKQLKLAAYLKSIGAPSVKAKVSAEVTH